jgi:hypothetical protein
MWHFTTQLEPLEVESKLETHCRICATGESVVGTVVLDTGPAQLHLAAEIQVQVDCSLQNLTFSRTFKL